VGVTAVAGTQQFDDLFQRLARVEEIEMRARLIGERLQSRSNEEIIVFVDEAHRGASMGAADAQAVFLAFGWTLFQPGLAKRRAALSATARQVGLHHVADLTMPPVQDDPAEQTTRQIPDFGRGRPLTLGERKSLARTHDRSLIQRVVRDPHPQVIRILLDNPSLTERDVVRVCALRPNDPAVLQSVYHHRRWVVRYRPRNALVRNPDTPLDIALLLAPLLRRGELKEAAGSSELAAPLRLGCKGILDVRDARSGQSST
jgi:hypothetical protein